MSTPSDKTLRLERTKLTPQPPRGGRNSTVIMAVIAGVAAAVVAGIWLNNQRQPAAQVVQAPAPVAPASTPIVVATVDIPAQTVIRPEMVKQSETDPTKLPQNAAGSTLDVINQVSAFAIKAGSTITRDQVAPNTQQFASMAAMVQPPFRAITIALDPISSVAGFLKPGDRVDVIGTFTGQGRTVTHVVLQNVYLLATGAQVVQQTPEIQTNNGGLLGGNNEQPQAQVQPAKPQEIPNATVRVTPIDAEKLILAATKGKLTLALRGNTDAVQSIIPTIDETVVTTIKTASQAPPPPAPVAPPLPPITKPAPMPVAPPAPSIMVIRGSTPQQVTVGT